MYKLNLGLDNSAVYQGCKITEFEPGRFRLETPRDSAVVIVAANLLKILQTVPVSDRDMLVLVPGGAPEYIRATAQAMLMLAFEELSIYNTREDIMTPIPQRRPPPDFDGEPE